MRPQGLLESSRLVRDSPRKPVETDLVRRQTQPSVVRMRRT
jgi:hypothetical protein